MTRLLRAEWRKVFTTRLWWGMLLGSVAFAALGVVAQIASNGQGGRAEAPLSAASTQQSVFASAAGGEIFSLIVGIIMITTEYRHFTSRTTFLIEPRRSRVVVAKLAMALLLGVLYGVCCVAVATAIAGPWLSAKGVAIGWVANKLALVMVGSAVVVTVYAVVGLGVGVLIRNQLAAVISALAYLFVLEPLIQIIPVVKGIYKFLPGAAAAATTAISTSRSGGTALLNQWQGGLVLLGWALLFSGLGWWLSVRRDVQ